MDNVLNKIIDIEKEACRIVGYVDEQRNAMPALVEKEIEEMNAKFSLKNEQIVAEHRKKREKESAAVIEKLTAAHKLKMAALKDSFDTHAKRWEDELFEAIKFA